MQKSSFISGAVANLRTNWKDLIVADLFYKLLAFTVLTPVFCLLLSGLLLLSGNTVLSDVDIAWFFIGPFGCFCAVLLGAFWIAILALEQASLIAILAASNNGTRLSVVGSLRFAASSAPSVLRVSARMVANALLVIAPFLLIASLIYSLTLGEYDINYYLAEKPFRFKLAAGFGIGLAMLLISLLFRLASDWFIVLPLVLFERVSPASALSLSRRVLAGSRFRVLLWLVVWLGIGLSIHMVATLVLSSAGGLLVSTHATSLPVLAWRVGLMLILLTVVGTLLNLLGTIGFSLVLFHAYQVFSPIGSTAIAQMKFGESKESSYVRRITRMRLTAFCIIGGLSAALIGIYAINALQLEDRVEVMAHRGASKVAPANSLAAFRKAIDAGSDWVEIDVQETIDGEVVVIHDSDLMKLARNKIKIWNATLAELQAIDIGSQFAPEFSAERVPTRGEVLTLCRFKIGVIIELKYYGHDQQSEQRVVDIVEQHGVAKAVMVMSLKPEGVKKLKAIRPEWKCGVLLSVSLGNIQNFNADFLAVNAKFASRSFVNRAHKAKIQVFAWTVDVLRNASQRFTQTQPKKSK